MPQERWLPINFELSDGIRLGKLRSAGEKWQIFANGRDAAVLVVAAELGNKWVSQGFLHESNLSRLEFGSASYAFLSSGKNHLLEQVCERCSIGTKANALAFAISLRETRKFDVNVPLHDAIYVEKFSRLLPIWTLSELIDDEHTLGLWLTGGVLVSIKSGRRIASLVDWLEKEDIDDIISAAAIDQVSPSGGGGGIVISRPGKSKNHSPKKGKTRKKRSVQDSTSDGKKKNQQLREFRIHGRPQLETFFRDHVIDIVQNEERYKALNIEFPSAIVLYGPPGCGKTFAVEQLVEYLDWPVFHIDSGSVGSPYIHETSRKVSNLFEKAMGAAPAVIVIDEMEAWLSDRQHNKSTGLHHVEEVDEFLRRIPEAMPNKVLVIGMTNRIEMIDDAIMRRGRFDHKIEVSMPSKEEVADLLDSLLKKRPVKGKLSLKKAIDVLTGRPLSDVAFVLREAARLAVRSGKDALDQASCDAAMHLLGQDEQDKEVNRIGF